MKFYSRQWFITNLASIAQRTWFHIAVIVFIALSLRLPLYHTVYWRTGDAIEYINLARNIASGQGFIQNIKFRYLDSYPVVTSSFHGRTSFLSIILAGIILIGGNEYTMQLFVLILGVLNACFVYMLVRKWVPPGWSILGGLLAATNPNLLINNRLVLSEPLFATFILVTLLIIYYLEESYFKYILAGVFSAFAYLTRSEGLFFLPVFVLSVGNIPKRFHKSIIMITSFFVISAPYLINNFIINGNPLFSEHTQMFSLRDLRDAVGGNGYGKIFPTPLIFIKENFFWIIHQEWLILQFFITQLFQLDFFGPLPFFVLLVFLKQSWMQFKVFYISAIIIFLVYLSVWSAQFELSRHFTALYLLLFIPLTYSLQKLRKYPVILIIVLVSLFLPYLSLDVHRIVWARTVDPYIDVWSQPRKEVVYEWIRKNTNKNDVISSTSPDMIYLHTNRPGIYTPNNLNKSNYLPFVSQYHVTYFLVESSSHNYNFFDNVAKVRSQFSDSRMYVVK